MKSLLILVCLCLIYSLGMIGCSSSSTNAPPQKPKRTYPQALKLDTVSVYQIINRKIDPPDSVNIDAFVVEINVCPENQFCFLPDGITLADSLHGDSQTRFDLTIYKPRQFTKNKEYLISVGLERRSPISNIIDIEPLGYSKISSSQSN